MTVIGKRPKHNSPQQDPLTIQKLAKKHEFQTSQEFLLWQSTAENCPDVMLSDQRMTELTLCVPGELVEGDWLDEIMKLAKVKIQILENNNNLTENKENIANPNEKQIKVTGPLLAIHTAHILIIKSIIQIENRPKPDAFNSFPEAFNLWKALVVATEHCLNQEVCIEFELANEEMMTKFNLWFDKLKIEILKKCECEIEQVEEGELAIGITGPCIGVHAGLVFFFFFSKFPICRSYPASSSMATKSKQHLF